MEKVRGGNFDRIEKLPFFLPLKNKTPSLGKNEFFFKKRELILEEFNLLEMNRRDEVIKIEELFSHFVYDHGAKDDYELSKENFNRLVGVNENLDEKTKKGVLIYNKKTLLSVAEEAILSRKKVAFVKFDIKNLRLIDKAGYADFTIRDLALVMNEVAEKYKNQSVIAARTGGDSFCFFLSSEKKIDQSLLDKLYKEVSKNFSEKDAYYLLDQSKEFIVNKKAKIKEEHGNTILANRQDEADRLLRSLSSGKIPNADDLSENKVTQDELTKLKSRIKKRQPVNISNNEADLKNLLKTIVYNHPELKVQTDLIDEWIKENKNINLAEYLLSFIDKYYVDPLFDEQVFEGPDFSLLLQSREKLDNEQIIYVYFPWLKNRNTRFGEKAVDGDIIAIYKRMCNEYFGSLSYRGTLPRGRKDGGDFLFISNSFTPPSIIMVDAENKGTSGPFKNQFPIFLITMDYPKPGESQSQLFENMKNADKIVFIEWLNKFYMNESRNVRHIAGRILEYYLEERTEDRCRELLLTIETMKDVSEIFKESLREKLIAVVAINKRTLYKEFELENESEEN